ncbi:uncharacterized protein BXZ73DRAFT_57482, partial [Epithele typhae]|uniref:uncharacterized protein n=1 Tax=Epithele typhae TaxID=378194 RepID=UPI0020074DC2
CEEDEDFGQWLLRHASRPPVLMRDFALGVDGGMIYPTFTSVNAEAAPLQVGPDVILEEDTRIGQCWRTTVPSQVGISTPVLIHPSNVTIDHIPHEIAADIRRAPRHMILWGVVDGDSNEHRLRTLSSLTSPRILSGHSIIALAEFEYGIHDGAPVQTFPVFDYIALSGMDFGIFLLDIMDNWGASDVCIYRVRIHGQPAQ